MSSVVPAPTQATRPNPHAPAAPAAVTATNPPAGGTGATAGAYDSAAHRDAAIASITALVTDMTALQAFCADLRTALLNAGVLAE